MDFPKKQQQCLIPRYLLQYLTSLEYHHTDPTAPWGGGGGGSYTAGDGIDITNDVISVDSTVVALKSDLSDYITSSELTTELSNYVTSTDLATELLDYAELSDLATVATTGSYNDLLNAPTIPDAVSGTNDGTNWTSLTIGSDTYGLASGGSTPTNMVTTDTVQTISGSKKFTGLTTFKGTYYDVYFGQASGFSVSDKNNPVQEQMSIYPDYLSAYRDTGNTTLDGRFHLGNHYFSAYNSDTEYKIKLVSKGGATTYGEYIFKNKTGDVAITSEIPTATSDLTNDSGYITSSALSGYATETWVTNQGYSTFSGSYNDLTNKPNLATVATTGLYSDLSGTPSLATVATTGDYGDLLNTPTIPDAVSGTYSGSNWTSITIGSTTKNIPSGGSAPTNMVTTDTAQDITAVKTFIGSKMIAFKEAADGNYLGFTAYNTAGNEFGNLQCGTRSVKLYTGSTASSENKKLVTIGNYSNNNTLQKDCYAGFRIKDLSGTQKNFVTPKSSFSTYYNVGGADTYYIPMGITDGNTTCLATSTGIIDISSLLSGGGGTTVSGTNDGTNWTSITIGSDTYGIPSGGGSGSGPSIYNFTSADWSGLTTSNSYINQSAMTREGLDLSTLTAGQTIKIDCVFVRPSNGTSYVHQFTLVIPDGTMATESTDTFQIPGTNTTNLQIEAFMVIASNKIGLYWGNTSQTRYISKVKVYPANA